MLEYQLLIPTYRDSDRLVHTQETCDSFHELLLDLAGGFSVEANCIRGVWTDAIGERVEDVSSRYTVAVSDYPAEEIRRIVRDACHIFDQQCIYVRFPDGTVELVSYDN